MAEAPNELEYFSIPEFKFSIDKTRTYPIKVCYQQFNLDKAANGTILIPTCYGGKVAATLNYKDGAFKEYHVIVAAMLGNGESSSPSNDVEGGFFWSIEHRLSGQKGEYSRLGQDGLGGLKYEDCINSQYQMLKGLGVNRLEAVLGFSMGGQQAYYWAVMHGSSSTDPFVKRIITICSSCHTSPHNVAFLEGPISSLTQSVDYADGAYRETNSKPTRGLRAFGRAYSAWLTSAAWYRDEKWKTWLPEDSKDGGVYNWLYPPVGKSSWENGWDADDMLILARMWQQGDIGTVHPSGSFKSALQSIQIPVLVMPSRTDQYFTWDASEIEMQYLAKGHWAPIETVWGHMAGGGASPEDTKWMDKRITKFLEETKEE